MYQFNLNDPDFLPHSGCNIDFSLSRGEIAVLVGENGIGKTTLARRFYHHLSLTTALIDQGPSDFFYNRKLSTIKELFLESRGHHLAKDVFDLCWESFSLDKKEDRFQNDLSGGEGQALKLSLGLPSKKELFILDEPSQYLDQNAKMKLSSILKSLTSSGKAFLIIEHDLTWLGPSVRVMELGVDSKVLGVRKTWTT